MIACFPYVADDAPIGDDGGTRVAVKHDVCGRPNPRRSAAKKWKVH